MRITPSATTAAAATITIKQSYTLWLGLIWLWFGLLSFGLVGLAWLGLRAGFWLELLWVYLPLC